MMSYGKLIDDRFANEILIMQRYSYLYLPSFSSYNHLLSDKQKNNYTPRANIERKN